MKKHYQSVQSWIFVLMLFFVHDVKAQDFEQILKLVPGELTGERKAGSLYGRSVAISGNYAVVSASQEINSSSQSMPGAVYVLFHSNDNWKIIKKIVLPLDETKLHFGDKVAISGEHIAATAIKKNGRPQLYLFSKNRGGNDNWGLIKNIEAPNLIASYSFAEAFSLNGDYLAVSSFLDFDGTVHLYKKDLGGSDNWGLLKTLNAPPSEDLSDYYGYSICINGDRLVVGAPNEDEDSSNDNFVENAGAAYIYRSGKGGQDNWGLMSKIVASTRGAIDNFGMSVAISGNQVIVGAPSEDHDATETSYLNNAGSAYIFHKESSVSDNWIPSVKLTAANRKAAERFGREVAIFADVAAVSDISAFGEEYTQPNQLTGSIHLFKQQGGLSDNWLLSREIEEPNADFNDWFGSRLAISADYLFVGAVLNDTDANGENKMYNSGSVYMYKRQLGGADNWGLLKKDTRTTAGRKAHDMFGLRVAMNGNYAVVTAPGSDQDEVSAKPVQDVGAAYVFENISGKWVLVKKLTDSTGTGYRLGTAVSLLGKDLIIGNWANKTDASGQNPMDEAGAVYYFSKDHGGLNNWGLVQKIVEPSRHSWNEFGSSVALSDDKLVIGSPGSVEYGNVYIYEKTDSGWWQHTDLLASDRNGYFFGKSVSISGEYLSIADMTRVIVYKNASANNWQRLREFSVGQSEAYNLSSWDNGATISTAITDDRLIISSPLGTDYPSANGQVMIYEKKAGLDDWDEVARLTAPVQHVQRSDFFGFSIAVSGDNILVGAPLYSSATDGLLNEAGGAYLFSKDFGGIDHWGMVKQFVPSSPNQGDFFGGSVAMNGNYLIIGSSGDDQNAIEADVLNDAGSINVYRKTSGDIREMIVPDQEGEYNSDYIIQEGDLTHYCTQNYILLSLKSSGSGAGIPANAVRFKIGQGATYHFGSTGFLSDKPGTAVLNRWWNVSPTTEPQNDVTVRFYYTRQDIDAINSALASNGKAPLANDTQLFFYKVTDNSLEAFADPASIPSNKVQLITHTGIPTLTSWEKGQEQGNYYAEFKVSSFSGGGAGGTSSGGSLPVKLMGFKATKFENAVFLQWTTSSEADADYFELQRSQDGKTWHTISKINAINQADTKSVYEFTDDNPFAARSFYRLGMVDFDRSVAYSGIRSIDLGISHQVVIYPNPTADKLFISGTVSDDIDFIELVDASGKLVTYQKVVREGITVKHLKPGMYTMRIATKNGQHLAKNILITAK